MVDGLLLCRSSALVANVKSLFNQYLDNASELEMGCIRHYDAIAGSNKGLEPHICLCRCLVRGESHKTIEDPGDPGYFSRHDAEAMRRNSDLPSTCLDKRSSATPEDVPGPQEMQHNERKNNLISWTDDDVDATDYKNMPDYDSDQEESEYDSTPEPESIPGLSSAEPGFTMAPPEPLRVQQYIKLQSKQESPVASESGKSILRTPRYSSWCFVWGMFVDLSENRSKG